MIISLRHLRLALVCVLVAATAEIRCIAAANASVTVTVTRRDLRPLPGVMLQLTGAANLQGVTDDNGHAAFVGLPAGAVSVAPSRSGFRFEPPQVTVPNPGNPSSVSLTAVPTTTDLALTMANDDPTPLVGGLLNGVITLRNLGTEAATDVKVGVGSLPGLALETAQVTQGALEFGAYATSWMLPQLNPGATAELRARSRATLPEANVLAVAVIEEMDQTDANPINNEALLTIHTRPAQARLSLRMTINPVMAKMGETLPVQVTLRNDGPHDATQVTLRTYLPPGASLLETADPSGLLSSGVIPRLAAGAQVQLNGLMRVRFSGTYTLVANVSSLEQQLPAGAAWPEARADFTVQPAFSKLALLAFTDPPDARVGEVVHVDYVIRNDGPNPVTGVVPFIREDARLTYYSLGVPNRPPPPVPGPIVFGEVLPVGAYTYVRFDYLIKAAGELQNYFSITSQDQPMPNADDYPELLIPIQTRPADVGLSLDANPKQLTVRSGDPVTMEFAVHNDGPQAARGAVVDYNSQGLAIADLDEVIHGDRVLRPGYSGYIDVVEPGETVRLRRHFVATKAGLHVDNAQVNSSFERPDLLVPIAAETIQLQVQPGPPPDLAISVSVDKPQVNVGEYAIFIVTIANRAAQPALAVTVRETEALDTGLAFETVRNYGPLGDDRISSGSLRTIPRIEPGASYSMSRTMRVRQAVTIPYLVQIVGVNGLLEADLPNWRAATQITGMQVGGDIALTVVPDRTNVKNGDLVNFAIITRNASARMASHIGVYTGESAGFQVLDSFLSGYGYYYDTARPRDLQSGAVLFSEWTEIGPQRAFYSWVSTYTAGAGQFIAGAQSGYLDQLDNQAANDLALVQINSAAASANVSVRQSVFTPNPSVGDFVFFLTEIRNEGPDRVTGLSLVESASANLELNIEANVNGVSGKFAMSGFDPLVRLPALDPGQNFIWQRTYAARGAGNAWRRVRVERFDQTALAPLPENEATVTVRPAQADLQLQLVTAPTVAQANIPSLVRVRVRNLGPAVATGVKVAVLLPFGDLSMGQFGLGPRASFDWLAANTFQTALRPGESATAAFDVTPSRAGTFTGVVQVQQSNQIDPIPVNDAVSFTLQVGPEPPIPPILRVRKMRTDFFDQTSIAELEIDQAALNRLAPFTTFRLEGSSNLGDWEFLRNVGLFPIAPVTFTDHAAPGAAMRTFRLRKY